jgi:lipoyl(octanoyl) transferase
MTISAIAKVATTAPTTWESPTIVRAGLIDYVEARQWQQRIADGLAEGKNSPTVLLLEHPSVYTAGRRTESHERPFDGTPVIEVDRGGKITWHGPGQLVGYPILRLPVGVGVVDYVRQLEAVLMGICSDLGVETGQVAGRSGVWVDGERKIAAIGVRVARGITQHGFALNVNPEMAKFASIVPCGIADADVTSLSIELGREITVDEVLPVSERWIAQAFS